MLSLQKYIIMEQDYVVRKEGPTPCGGAYSEAVFFDKDGRRCKESEAFRIVIKEFKKKGKSLKSTYGFMKL